MSLMRLVVVGIPLLTLPILAEAGPAKTYPDLRPLVQRQADPSITREPFCISEALCRISREHGISPILVQAIIQVESQGNPRAVSRKGAMGLMQLMPEVLRRYRVSDPFDPLANLQAGVRHLNYLVGEFSGNPFFALAAYNAGPAPVRKYRGIPPYPETRKYLRKVIREYQRRVNEPVFLLETLRAGKIAPSGKILGEKERRRVSIWESDSIEFSPHLFRLEVRLALSAHAVSARHQHGVGFMPLRWNPKGIRS